MFQKSVQYMIFLNQVWLNLFIVLFLLSTESDVVVKIM